MTAALIAGCGGDDDGARAAADTFTAAVERRDWSTACQLLTPGTRAEIAKPDCASGLADLRLATSNGGTVEVWGDAARVGGIFLIRADGWRVAAAGCTPTQHGRPYDCALEA